MILNQFGQVSVDQVQSHFREHWTGRNPQLWGRCVWTRSEENNPSHWIVQCANKISAHIGETVTSGECFVLGRHNGSLNWHASAASEACTTAYLLLGYSREFAFVNLKGDHPREKRVWLTHGDVLVLQHGVFCTRVFSLGPTSFKRLDQHCPEHEHWPKP